MSDWCYEKWTTAWGRNAPLIVSTTDYPIPMAPEGHSWLLTRHLQAGTGRPVIEMRLLLDTDFNRVAIATTSPAQEEVVAAAKKIVDAVQQKNG